MSLKLLIKQIIPKDFHPRLARLYLKCKYPRAPFACPFCGGHFRELLPEGFDFPVLKEKTVVGGGYRLNATCPRCGSSDRDRLIYLYLRHKTNIFTEKLRMLHVAPEPPLRKAFLAPANISYVSADLNSPSAMVQMDITNIPYGDNAFDVVICNHVLEHIPNDRSAMSELYRILRPQGWAILQVPISLSLDKTFEDPTVTTPEEREKAFGQSDHVRIYARDYRDRLEAVGFSVAVEGFVRELPESAVRRYALQKDENLYFCWKPAGNGKPVASVSAIHNRPKQ